ncbi:MAG TPA: hypothetical protein VNR89_24315 [Roseomonas sp.]|nr:hypothetical protein [Roseomonas sp.]
MVQLAVMLLLTMLATPVFRRLGGPWMPVMGMTLPRRLLLVLTALAFGLIACPACSGRVSVAALLAAPLFGAARPGRRTQVAVLR